MRKPTKFPEGEIFHVFNKSIAGFKIYSDFENSRRFFRTINYYNSKLVTTSLGVYLANDEGYNPDIFTPGANPLMKILAYCIMPDHYHLLLKIIEYNSLPKYINKIEASYTRFFNIKYERKGPLWQSDYRAVLVRNNEQLLHLSRYIHLNPTTSNLVQRPEEWIYSSYKDYISRKELLANFLTEISIKNQLTYKQFVENNIDYLRKLRLIKKLLLD